jgi:hypothetical protein
LLLNLYDDNFSVLQFQEFLLENEKDLGNLADEKRCVRREDLCQDKIDLVDQLIHERGIEPSFEIDSRYPE